MSKPLILVDGSSYFFRAFHALPSLMTSKGQHTGAIYGVLNMVKKLIKDYEPEKMAVVFDAKGPTFRNEWYSEYKANRSEMPDDLKSQFHYLVDCLKALGIDVIIVEGVEADDVIGTLTKQALEAEYNVLISTSDKDMAQLVNDRVTLVNTMSREILDVAGVQQKYGLRVDQFIDYLTLIGDTSDNIPGVPKCGPKTAVKWINEFETLENLIANQDNIAGKIGENLRAAIPNLDLYKRLITIKTDVDVDIDINELNLKPQNTEKLLELVKELEFKTLLNELLTNEHNNHQEKQSQESVFSKQDYTLITDDRSLDKVITELKSSDAVSIELNVEEIDFSNINILGLACVLPDNKIYYIETKDKEYILNTLKEFFENPEIAKIGHNLKYTYTILKKHNMKLAGNLFDTMLESYVLNPTSSKHDLDSLSLVYLNQKIMPTVGSNASTEQAVQKAWVNKNLHEILYAKLNDDLKNILLNIDAPLVRVLAEMEYQGVMVDCDVLFDHGKRLKEQIELLSDEAYKLAGKVFNLNSPKQLQEVLFIEQKLPVIAKTQKGQPSTQESVLQELALNYRLPAVILSYRSLSKLVSTYIDALPKKQNPVTKRIHTSYNQAITATGRLSSTEPNLQNIPIRNEEGRLIRTAFVAPVGCKILAADYSQIELRVMAHISRDEALINAFMHGWDIHAATASELFDVAIEDVTAEQRRQAKVVNFGLIYGMSSFGLASRLKLTQDHAKAYIAKYFERFPGVRDYMDTIRKTAREQGYVETIFKRRLYLPEINAQNRIRQMAAERAAINAPMQGTAADIIKKAMIDFHNVADKKSLKMIMQVHDELVFEVQEDMLTEATSLIKNLMETTVTLDVPLIVTVGVGNNWDEAH